MESEYFNKLHTIYQPISALHRRLHFNFPVSIQTGNDDDIKKGTTRNTQRIPSANMLLDITEMTLFRLIN